jgi:hypothetical protein
MVLPPFMAIAQAMGCHPCHNQEVREGLDAFISKKLKQNFIADLIEKQGLTGVRQVSV